MCESGDVFTFPRASIRPSSRSCLLKVNALLPGDFYSRKVKFKDKHHKFLGIISNWSASNGLELLELVQSLLPSIPVILSFDVKEYEVGL